MIGEFIKRVLPQPSSQKTARDGAESLRALDELFLLAGKFSTRKEYKELIEFVAKFRAYSPFNAMLVRIQMPGATYVASPKRWHDEYKRNIRNGARPITILQPGGPVMFVFDVNDTVPQPNAPELPRRVTHPFEIVRGDENGRLDQTVSNAVRDGVRTAIETFGSQQGGQIASVSSPRPIFFSYGRPQQTVAIPLRYEISLNAQNSRNAQYATLIHELAHLYCGHLGSSNPQWWPDRPGLSKEIEECEAESIAYLVCSRIGIETQSAAYISGYLSQPGKMPPISLDLVMKVAGEIYDMGKHRLQPRKESKK